MIAISKARDEGGLDLGIAINVQVGQVLSILKLESKNFLENCFLKRAKVSKDASILLCSYIALQFHFSDSFNSAIFIDELHLQGDFLMVENHHLMLLW